MYCHIVTFVLNAFLLRCLCKKEKSAIGWISVAVVWDFFFFFFFSKSPTLLKGKWVDLLDLFTLPAK